jgi:hypothetical protein
MTIFPKRVWTKKGMVFHDKKPVRQLGDKVWVYDPNFTEVDSWKVYPEKAWENVPATDELLIYDWEQPTEIWTFEDGLESTYQFVDYDWSVLKSWKVKDWETPVAPADPTREHYTFTGWNPTVWPISKNTTFTATYVWEPCTVSATASTGGTVSPASITVPYWSDIDVTVMPSGISEVTIAGQTIEWEPDEKYEFYNWEWIPQSWKVTGDLTINFVFQKAVFTVTFEPRCGGCFEDVGGWTISPSSVEVRAHTSIESSENILTIYESHDGSYEPTIVTATADSWYVFNWWVDGGDQSIVDGVPYYVEDDITIYAHFYY